jgi:hypothetical protein
VPANTLASVFSCSQSMSPVEARLSAGTNCTTCTTAGLPCSRESGFFGQKVLFGPFNTATSVIVLASTVAISSGAVNYGGLTVTVACSSVTDPMGLANLAVNATDIRLSNLPVSAIPANAFARFTSLRSLCVTF